MIPKIIHYCWFGNGELPEKDKKCIESWKKYCPDYEIKEWNESNYNIHKNKYMEQAYESKKWGFVSDYARLDIIYEHGGVYLDTDVEIIRNIDELLENHAFMGFEGGNFVAPGLGFGAEKESKIIGDIMHAIYDDKVFIKANGEIDLIPSPQMNTEYLVSCGLKQNNSIQEIEDLMVYPKEYFCPMDYDTGEINITEHTYSIHHYHASWKSKTERKCTEIARKLANIFGDKIGKILAKMILFPFRLNGRIKQNGISSAFKYYLKKCGECFFSS